MNSTNSLFIAAGGTGGHIYPGIALAEALKEKNSQLKIYFVGTEKGLENTLVPPKGFQVLHLPIGRLNSNVPKSERLKTLFSLPFAFIKAYLLLRKFKPSRVVGIGGHASGPMLLVASLFRTPTVIWEPNAMPGMANRWLAPFVDLACIVFEEARRHLKAKNFMLAGMPLRKEVEALHKENLEARNPIEKFKVFVFGGSQGAKGINSTLVKTLKEFPEMLEGFEFVHQTGAADYDRIRSEYGSIPVDLKLYINDMPNVYRWADVIVCRSGASTLAELSAVGKPAILIPFPFASDNHQQKNAEAFANEEAALMILQKDLTPQVLRENLTMLKDDPELCKKMGHKIKDLFTPQAAQAIAERVLQLAKI